MSIEIISIIIFASMILVLIAGLPIAFTLGGLGVLFILLFWGPQALPNVALQIFSGMRYFILIAMPMFIFMGVMLQRSGIADDLFNMIYSWSGPLRGGLAIGTVLICTMFAAMVGLTGPATVTMGLIALPAMLKRGYNKNIALGVIPAGGALGFLIPPSVSMLTYALFAQASVGMLFAGGVLPGLLLAALFIIYIGIRSYLQPEIAPAIPKEDRVSWKEKVVSLRSIILPVLLMGLVLGTIFVGWATPTEASAIGAIGSVICAVVYRKFSWNVLKDALWTTFKLNGMIMWIVFGALVFSSIYVAVGASDFIKSILLMLPLGPWGIVIVMQLTFFILGTVLDDFTILVICIPLYVPIITDLGFDPVWFGILYMVNMQMAYLTPPFGWNIFYMKSIAPPGISMADIYRSVIPFVILQGIGLAIIMAFPQIVLWLPRLLFSR